MNGLTTVNIELSSRCNKSCWMCGRRKIDRDYPEIAMDYGDMDSTLVTFISRQLPNRIVVQFHNNGESLLHPDFGDMVSLFNRQIRCMNTNGKLLLEKSDQVINNLDTMTISVIQDDPEGEEQLEIVKKFLELKGNKSPFMTYRLLGNIENKDEWEKLPGLVVNRILHNPMGSRDYVKPVTIPEIGICLDFLNHLSIDRFGKVSICVRFDPERVGVIGDVNNELIKDIWSSGKRLMWIHHHINGERDRVPLCSKCHFWGVPRG